MSVSPIETWTLQHPDRGLIEVHVGTDQQLRGIDPGFPVVDSGEEPPDPVSVDIAEPDDLAASSEVASEEEPEAAEQDFLERQLAKLKSDAPKHRVLIRIEGEPVGRLKDLRNFKVSLKPEKLEELEPGEYTASSQALEAPMIKLESNLMDSWLRSVVFKVEGQPGIELDPPKDSFAAKRLAAMAASPWKRVVYPLSAGLGKGGWALASLILIPVVIRLLEPVITWIRELLPEWEINIPWPDIPWPDINWPDINIPWPDINWPDFTAPGWVLFLLDYSKVWVPVLIGLGIGIVAVRRHRKSQELKRRWAAGGVTPGKDDDTREQARDEDDGGAGVDGADKR